MSNHGRLSGLRKLLEEIDLAAKILFVLRDSNRIRNLKFFPLDLKRLDPFDVK